MGGERRDLALLTASLLSSPPEERGHLRSSSSSEATLQLPHARMFPWVLGGSICLEGGFGIELTVHTESCSNEDASLKWTPKICA